MSVIGLKWALAVASGLVGLWLPAERRILELTQAAYRRALWLSFGAARVPLFLVLYVWLGLDVPSDVAGYYVPQAEKALSGQLVYRDFPSSYGPGFPYLAGTLLALTGSAEGLVALSVGAEMLALHAWGRLARLLLWPEVMVRRGELLYVSSAVPLLTIGVAGQNQSWLALTVALSLLAAAVGSSYRAALWAVLGAWFVKFLALLFWPLVWSFLPERRHRVGFTLGVVLSSSIAWGGLFACGADPTLPARLEGGLTTPGNLPALLALLLAPLGVELPLWARWSILLAAVLGTLGLTRGRWGPPGQRAWQRLGLLWLAFLICAPKAYPGYFVLAALPITMVAAETRATRAVYAVWQLGLALWPSVWFRLGSSLDERSGSGLTTSWLLVVLHVGVLAPGAWLFLCGLRQGRRPDTNEAEGASVGPGDGLSDLR